MASSTTRSDSDGFLSDVTGLSYPLPPPPPSPPPSAPTPLPTSPPPNLLLSHRSHFPLPSFTSTAVSRPGSGMAGWGRTAGPGLLSPTTFAAAHGPGLGGGGADPTPPAAPLKDQYVSESKSDYDSLSESQPSVLLRNGRLFVHEDCKFLPCSLPRDCQRRPTRFLLVL